MTLRSEVRAVFDTNVPISAFLFPTSTPRRAVDFALDHGKLLISLSLLRELYGVLQYPKFDEYASPAQRMQFVNLLTTVGTLTTITVQLQVARDPKDNSSHRNHAAVGRWALHCREAYDGTGSRREDSLH
jgi:putative PIN family toxin of toxin-antitoxin system